MSSDGRKVDLVSRLLMYADSVMTQSDVASLELETALPAAEPTANLANIAEASADVSVEVPAAQADAKVPIQDLRAACTTLEALSLTELREACTSQGLHAKGSKFDLIERLAEHATQPITGAAK